ncbi:MAG TPA: hypothetical protein VH044_04880, partial [Polyangiaceae bacterium]|nr:hypothetical protein [Polyangiaceae bacterium]
LDPGSERRPSAQPPEGATSIPPQPVTPSEAPSPLASETATPVPPGDIPTPVPPADIATPVASAVATEIPAAEAAAPAAETEPPHEGEPEDERDLTRLDALAPALAAEAAVTAPPPVDASSVGIDFGDTTYPHSVATSPPTESELVIDVDASGETSAIDVDDDIIVADEMAEEVEGDEDPQQEPTEPPQPGPSKRSVPPPLPRGS